MSKPETTVPAGWKLVPIEPTKEMADAFDRAAWCKLQDAYGPCPTEHPEDGGGSFGYGWRAMLYAVPAPSPALENGSAPLADATNNNPSPLSEAPAEGRVVVKALEWKDPYKRGVCHGMLFLAKCPIAMGESYRITDAVGFRLTRSGSGSTLDLGIFKAVEDAQRAAQSDLETRILSALTTPPAPSPDALAKTVEPCERCHRPADLKATWSFGENFLCDECFAAGQAESDEVEAHEMQNFGGAYGVPERPSVVRLRARATSGESHD